MHDKCFIFTIFSHFFPAQGQNPARQASIKAGIPNNIPACGVNMLCGSGLRSVVLGMQAIKNGDAKIVVAGGQESMSKVSKISVCCIVCIVASVKVGFQHSTGDLL